MNLIAIALIAFFQFGRATSSIVQCEDVCEGIRKGILSATEREACKAAKSTSIIVFNACQHGTKAAFGNCPSLCGGKETTMVSTSKACKGITSSEQWCRKGFASTMSKLQAYNFPEFKSDIVATMEESNDEVAIVAKDEGENDEIEPAIPLTKEKDERFDVDFNSEAKDGQDEEVKEAAFVHEQTTEDSDMQDVPLLSEAVTVTLDTDVEDDAF